MRFVRVNDALAEINGLPAADHRGKTLGDVKPELAGAVPRQPLCQRRLPALDPARDYDDPAVDEELQ
ncbi:MAG: hypothetical protein ACXWZB_06155 [Gaiellaceae bacterium]